VIVIFHKANSVSYGDGMRILGKLNDSTIQMSNIPMHVLT